jgi:putative oxidoreductase
MPAELGKLMAESTGQSQFAAAAKLPRGTQMNKSDDLAKLVLRLTLALLLLFHGVAKLMNGVGPIEGMLAKAGLPDAIAYLSLVGELVAPILILIGLWTRPAALIVVINMIVAVALAHTGQLLSMSKSGGWALELQAFFLFTALAIALLGAGRHSVGGAAGKWN